MLHVFFVNRALSLFKVKEAVKNTIEMQKRYPDIVVGFDLVINLI